MSRFSLALKSFFALLFHGKLPEDITVSLNLTRRLIGSPPARPAAKPAAPAPPPTPARAADGAIQVLALLQRESRLIDFLTEDIASFTNEQVGAAVRDVHNNARHALESHLKLSPVVDGVEGTPVTLANTGLDPADSARLRIVGKVPPDGQVLGGILRHRGWRATSVELPPLAPGERAQIIAPAEIEVE